MPNTTETDKDPELEGLIAAINGEQSDLARVLTMPRAKDRYLQLHPETGHGKGRSKQAAKSAPCFVTFMAQRCSVSERTIDGRLRKAEELATLGDQTRTACLSCGLSNNIGLLLRIARIPDPGAQLSVVDTYRESNSISRAKILLSKLEQELGLYAKPGPESAAPEPESDQTEPTGTSDGAHVLEDIQRSLGATEPEQCLGAIEGLKRMNEQQRAVIDQQAAKISELQAELAKAKPSRRAKAA